MSDYYHDTNESRKRCEECGACRPRSQFHVFHSMPDGLTPWCKDCSVERANHSRLHGQLHDAPQLGDPGPERIATLCREIQGRWTAGQKRRAIERARRATGCVK